MKHAVTQGRAEVYGGCHPNKLSGCRETKCHLVLVQLVHNSWKAILHRYISGRLYTNTTYPHLISLLRTQCTIISQDSPITWRHKTSWFFPPWANLLDFRSRSSPWPNTVIGTSLRWPTCFSPAIWRSNPKDPARLGRSSHCTRRS